MRSYYTIILLFFLVFASHSADAQLQSQTTPEYSGPSAKFDRNFDDYRAQRVETRRQYTRADDIQRAIRNDRAFETNTARRNVIIQEELTRRAREAPRQTINE